jgi:hypothetical protein
MSLLGAIAVFPGVMEEEGNGGCMGPGDPQSATKDILFRSVLEITTATLAGP